MKKPANVITALRIVFAGILAFLNPQSSLFLSVYVICGVSDVADGYIARRTHTESKFGATLDSIADFVFIGVLLVKFIPIVRLPAAFLIWILCIAFVKLLSFAIGYYKYHALAFIHTYANKATGLVLFCFPLLYSFLDITAVAWLICSVASLSAAEELVINIKSEQLLCDTKSIFFK